jgi:NTP pyrophosphatase (non-canonical NTP hydrolase)
MDYNKLSKEVHQNAENKGFWKQVKSDEHCLTLVFTEICEAVEADRKNKRADKSAFLNIKGKERNSVFPKMFNRDTTNAAFVQHVKDTIEDELADAMIRLLDLAGHLQIDFTKLPDCRYYRAFPRFSFTENAFALIKGLSKEQIGIEKRIQFGLHYLSTWAKELDIDLSFHVTEKMMYNQTREMMHGKLY